MKIFILFFLLLTNTFAANFPLPERLDQEILADDSPTAWRQNKLGVEDFTPEWVGQPVEGVSFYLGKKSYDLVRSIDVLALPKARLKIIAENIQSGNACNGAGCQSFSKDSDGKWIIDLPVALLGGSSYATKLTLTRNDKTISALIGISFTPKSATLEQLVSTDPSCSPYQLTLKSFKSGSKPLWLAMGCRLIYSEGDEHRTSSLVAYTYWEGKSDTNLKLDGSAVQSVRPKLFVFDLKSQPGTFTLSDDDNTVELSYSIPERLHFARMSAGIGPYWLNFTGNGENVSSPSALASFYAAYYLTKSTSITSFASIMPDSHLNTTFGFYFRNLSFTFFDRRFVIYLNIGGHFQGFQAMNQYNFLWTFPQGSELKVVDPWAKGHDLTIGGFLQPSVNNVGYTEFWLRYGTTRMFGELNYINRFQPVNGVNFMSQSIGITLGHYFGGAM